MKKTALVTGGGPTGEKPPQGLDLQRKRRGKKNFSGPGKRFLSQSAGKALRQSLPGLPAGAVLLPVAEELGLPFSLLDLKVYETKKKARYHQDVALTEEELAQPLEEHHYWLLEHGWEFARPEEGSCGD